MTDTSKYTEAFRCEYEATRSLDRAVAAVVTAVKAQLELVFEAKKPPRTIRRAMTLGKKPGAHFVLRAAALEFGVEAHHLGAIWARRSPPHMHAKWVAWAILRKAPFELSTPECAYVTGDRDHTRVLYGLKQLHKDPALLEAAARVEAVIRSGDRLASPTTSATQEAA